MSNSPFDPELTTGFSLAPAIKGMAEELYCPPGLRKLLLKIFGDEQTGERDEKSVGADDNASTP